MGLATDKLIRLAAGGPPRVSTKPDDIMTQLNAPLDTAQTQVKAADTCKWPLEAQAVLPHLAAAGDHSDHVVDVLGVPNPGVPDPDRPGHHRSGMEDNEPGISTRNLSAHQGGPSPLFQRTATVPTTTLPPRRKRQGRRARPLTGPRARSSVLFLN
jgi:hypothetical protein